MLYRAVVPTFACLALASGLAGLACGADPNPGESAMSGDATGMPDNSSGPDAPPEDASSSGAATPFLGCEGDSEAHEVFNHFWRVLDENYAVFDLRLVGETWDAVGHQECAAITAQMSSGDLFDALIRTAEHLDDGHIQLSGDGREGDGWVNEYPHYDALYELELNVESNYLDSGLTWDADDWFAWGRSGEFGYVSITSMDSLSPSGDEDDDVAAASAAMTTMLADLGQTSGLVVDVRANEGGWDAVALTIAQFIEGPETIAWSEAVRDGPEHDDFAAWEDTIVEGSGPEGYTGPVVVLSSGGTFSAAEVFLLAMRVRSNVTILGERGSGHLSDTYDAELPNGWEFVYSGERYRAADGEIYEAIGVPVDLEVPFDLGALADGTDVMFEAALSELGGR